MITSVSVLCKTSVVLDLTVAMFYSCIQYTCVILKYSHNCYSNYACLVVQDYRTVRQP